MQIKYSWAHRAHEILQTLTSMDDMKLGRSEIELVFGVRRRAALRLMEKLNPKRTPGGEWEVDRIELEEWLSRVADEIGRESSRSEIVRNALSRAEMEKQQLREELKQRGLDNRPVWTVDPVSFTRGVRDLSPAITLSPGTVTVCFSDRDPASGAQLLHELSLAMLSDWRGFCARVGTGVEQSREETIESVLIELELERLGGSAK